MNAMNDDTPVTEQLAALTDREFLEEIYQTQKDILATQQEIRAQLNRWEAAASEVFANAKGNPMVAMMLGGKIG